MARFPLPFAASLCLLAMCVLTGCARLSVAVGGHSSSCSRAAGVFKDLLACSRNLGLVSGSQPVSFLLLLQDSSQSTEARDVAAMYDPRSSRYEHFLRPSSLRRLGPSKEMVSHVASALRRLGVQVIWAPGDSWLSVRGSASVMARAFGVSVRRYVSPSGQHFLASARDPILPDALRGDVAGVSHLESVSLFRPKLSGAAALAPADIESAYHITPLRNEGLDGAGQTVVFFEIDGYRQSDLDGFTRRFHLPPMHPVIRAGPRLAPGGEAPMDLEAVHAIAPGARLVVYNLDQSQLANQAGSDAEFLDALLRFQERIVNENPRAIVSNSVGSCAEALGSAAAQAFKRVYDRADALGEAWFAASGDQGAYDCLQALEQAGDPPARRDIGVDLPASAPGVTGVGGTRIVSGGARPVEAAWEGPVETSGGGGGVSGFFRRPSWQRAPGVGDPVLDPHGRREVPDVSAIADPATSGEYVIDGGPTVEGGTSQAAPIWAGIMALADQYLIRHGARRLGFANPALYALARATGPYAAFHDVTLGGNLVYPATRGYDMASGLGTPDAWNLARDLLAYSRGGAR